MTQWPQIFMLAWLTTGLGVAVLLTAPSQRRTGWLILGQRAQRIAVLAYAASALGETLLLWQGGFFEGMF